MPIDSTASRSSRNAVKSGLYTAHDFIREGEEEEYAALLTSLLSELAPEGVMEQTFAAEVMGATWRLRRCRMAEEAFSAIDNLDFDPMLDERTEKQQRSVDRARSHSHLILRRSIAELRKLQTQRTILLHAQEPDIPRLTDIKQVASALKAAGVDDVSPQHDQSKSVQDMSMGEFEAMLGLSDAQLNRLANPIAYQNFTTSPVGQVPELPPSVSSFCNQESGGLIATKSASPAQDRGQTLCKPAEPKVQTTSPGRGTPRNAPCPCGSGAKHKRCCGNAAPPQVLNRAA